MKQFAELRKRLKYVALVCVLIVSIVSLLGLSFVRLSMDKDHVSNQDLALVIRSIPKPLRGKFPILLHHGIFPIITLHSIARDLRNQGYQVFSAQISAAAAIEDRAKALAPLVDRVLSATGAEKINIVAHSMGGLDARFLISSLGYGDKIATLTTIASPHRGSVLAKFVSTLPFAGFITGIVNLIIGAALDGSTWWSVDVLKCMVQLSPDYLADVFNPQNPDDDRVKYRSYAGIAGPPTNIPGDPVTFWTRPLMTPEGENDGIVTVKSAQWGEFRGVIPAPHSVLIGRPQMIPLWNYDAGQFFTKLASDLNEEGY